MTIETCLAWLRERAPLLRDPAVFIDAETPGATRISFSWDEAPHHLEIDLIGPGWCEWFYRDRGTDHHVGGEGVSLDDARLFAALRLFVPRMTIT